MTNITQYSEQNLYIGNPDHKECTQKNAWVVLVMLGDLYLPGALIVAKSLRLVNTKHDIVCMVTNDVSINARNALSYVYDHVLEVSYITCPTKKFKSNKQNIIYNDWLTHSYTKWNCLSLIAYQKIILIDADMLIMCNCDDLFSLSSPAACYSNPWIDLPDAKNPIFHNTRITSNDIVKRLQCKTLMGWATMILLKPETELYNNYKTWLMGHSVFGNRYKSISGGDEVSIAAYYSEKLKLDWTHIHPRYLAIPWKLNWVSRDIRAFHFHGRKPWCMNLSEWPDLELWWSVADKLIIQYPHYRDLLYSSIA